MASFDASRLDFKQSPEEIDAHVYQILAMTERDSLIEVHSLISTLVQQLSYVETEHVLLFAAASGYLKDPSNMARIVRSLPAVMIEMHKHLNPYDETILAGELKSKDLLAIGNSLLKTIEDEKTTAESTQRLLGMMQRLLSSTNAKSLQLWNESLSLFYCMCEELVEQFGIAKRECVEQIEYILAMQKAGEIPDGISGPDLTALITKRKLQDKASTAAAVTGAQ